MLSDYEIELLAERISERVSEQLPVLLSLRDVSRILGYSYGYMRRVYRQLGIPYILLPHGKGTRIKIRVKDLLRWLDERTIDPSRVKRNLLSQRSKEQRRRRNASVMASR